MAPLPAPGAAAELESFSLDEKLSGCSALGDF